MIKYDPGTELADTLDLETLEKISTVPSIDKKFWADNGGFRPHNTSVFGGGFIGDFAESMYRNITLGNAIAAAKGISAIADTVTELGGDAFAEAGLVNRELASKIVGRVRGELFPNEIPNTIDREIVRGNPNVFANKLDNFGMHLRQRFENTLAEREEEHPIQGTAGEFFGSVTSSILTAVGLNVLGGVKMAAGVFSVQSAIDTYTATKDAGNEYKDNLAYALTVGVLNYNLEKIGLDRVFKSSYVSGTKFIRGRILSSMLTEGVTEMLQQEVQIEVEAQAGARPNMTLLDQVTEVLYAGAAGVVAGGGMTSAIAITQRISAVNMLKEAGVENPSKVVDEITQKVSNHIVNRVGEEFDFNEASNRIYQEVKNTTNKNKETMQRLHSTVMGERGITEEEAKKKISELQSMDPAVGVMNEINAEVMSDVVENTQGKTGKVTGLGEVNRAIKDLDAVKKGTAVKLPEPDTITFSSKIGEESRNIIKGRLKYIKSEIRGTQNKLKEVEKNIVKQEKEGKSVVALEKKANKLIDKFFSQISEYQSIYENPDAVNIREGKVLTDANTMTNILGRSIKNLAREVGKAYKQGVRATNQQRRMIRTAITKMVSVKGMSREAKDYIYRKYNKAMTPEQFMKILPSIQSDIDMMVEEHYKDVFTRAIDTLANVMLGKTKKGKRLIKLDARSQGLADNFVDIYTADDIDVNKIIADNDGSPEVGIKIMAANLATGKDIVTGQELSMQYYRDTFETLRDFVTEGRKSKIFRNELSYQANEKLKEKIIGDIKTKSDNKGVDIGNKLLSLGTWFTRTYNTMNGLIFRNVGQEIGGSVGEKVFDVKRQLQIAETLRLFHDSELRKVWEDSYGVKGLEALDKIRLHDIDPNNSLKISWEDYEGNWRHENLTIAEAREKLMLSYRMDGFKKLSQLGWTQEAFDIISDNLTKADHDFIYGQLDIMSRMFDPINEAHIKTTGVPLNYSQFYSPLITEATDLKDTAYFHNMMDFGSKSQSSLDDANYFKTVTNKKVKLANIPDFRKTEKYIRDMSYYIGMAEKMKQIQQIMGDSGVKSAISETYSPQVLASLERHVKVMTRNTTSDEGHNLHKGMNNLITRYAQGVLSTKPIQFFKQLTSAFTAIEAMPIKDYVKYVSEIPEMIEKGLLEDILNDPYIIGRYRFRSMGLEFRYVQDLLDSAKTNKYTTVLNNPVMNRLLFLPVQYGDIGGVLLNTLPVYQHYLNKGMSKAEALQRAIDHTDRTQQSGRATESSAFALSPDPIRRLITTFTHTPTQYINRVYDVMQTIGTERFNPNDAAKKYFLYFVLLPTIYSSISMGLKAPDKDKFIEKAFLGPFDQAVILGPMLEWAFLTMYTGGYNTIMGENKRYPDAKRVGSSIGIMGGMVGNLGDTRKAISKLFNNGMNPVDFFHLTTQLAEATLPVTGGIGGLAREVSGGIEGAFRANEEGDFVTSWRRYLMMLGLSEYATRGGKK